MSRAALSVVAAFGLAGCVFIYSAVQACRSGRKASATLVIPFAED